ncbi:phage tail protein [Pseudomonas sp. BW16M2]|uniref:phage tail protein n=1 Tax=Pseudomonas sp. BW16M2 TaxID=2745489 RepID=UPI001EE34ADF|nr:phage tail protein [Pseudomonas sp. BW16M2]
MVDQNTQFFAILTNVGAAKQANADALSIPWKITQMGVGDANGVDPTPSAAQTRLINEWRRASLNQLKVDDKDASVIVAEQVIPADVGGHWIREIALYDADGDMVAVANCAPTYKPLLSQGSGRTQVVRMNLVVSSASNVQLKIDPSVVLATREYVDAAILNVLPKNKTPGTYTKVEVSDRGLVLKGYNPTTLAGFGITDALPNLNPLPSGSLDLHGGLFAFLTSPLESSACANCYWNGSDWLRHDVSRAAVSIAATPGGVLVRRAGPGANPIVWTISTALDSGNILFSHLQQLPAALADHGIKDAYTKTETQQRIDTAVAALVGSAPGVLDQLDEIARALGNDPNFATTMLNKLATKADKGTKLADYGILDALPNLNPLPGGSYDLHGANYAFITSPNESSLGQNAYWNGSQWVKHDNAKAAIAIGGAGGIAVIRKWGPGVPTSAGATTSEIVDTGMQATAEELDEGTSNKKWVSVGGLAYYFGRKLKTAGEVIAGITRYATLAEVVAGASGYLAVCPSYLVAGFGYRFDANGYIKLPTWLGGLMVQWSLSDESLSETDYRYFPVAFTSVVYGAWLQLYSGTTQGFAGNYGTILSVIDVNRYVWTAAGTWGGGGKGWIFALGR